jgi:hypothetical protein
MPPRNPFAALDPYYLQFLAAHLDERGRVDDLHRLLTLETADGLNAWFDAKDAADDTLGFADDVLRGRRRAAAAPDSGPAREHELLYSLMLASVNSLADDVSPQHVAYLVGAGTWTLRRGIASVGFLTEGGARAVGFSRLASLAPREDAESLWLRALREVDALDEAARAKALDEIAPQVPAPLYEAVAKRAREVTEPHTQAILLLRLVHAVVGEARKAAAIDEADALVRKVETAAWRKRVMPPLVIARAELEGFPEAWRRLDAETRTECLRALIDQFDRATMDEAVTAAEGMADRLERDRAFLALLDRALALDAPDAAARILERLADPAAISEGQRALAVDAARRRGSDAAVAMARTIPRLAPKVRAMIGVASTLSREGAAPLLEEAMAMARGVFNVRERNLIALERARCALRQGARAEAVEILRRIQPPAECAEATAALAGGLGADVVPLLGELAARLGFAAVAGGVAALDRNDRAKALQEMGGYERRIGDDTTCIRAIAHFGHLDTAIAGELLERLERLPAAKDRALALEDVVPVLPDECVERARSIAESLEDALAKERATVPLVARTARAGADDDTLAEQLERIVDPECAARARAAVAREVAPPRARRWRVEALNRAADIVRPLLRFDVLADIEAADAELRPRVWAHAIEVLEQMHRPDASAEEIFSWRPGIVERIEERLEGPALERIAAIGEDVSGARLAVLRRRVAAGDRVAAEGQMAKLTGSRVEVSARIAMAGLLPVEERDTALAPLLDPAAADGGDRLLELGTAATPGGPLQVQAWERCWEGAQDDARLLKRLAKAWTPVDRERGRRVWSRAVERMSSQPREQALLLVPELLLGVDLPEVERAQRAARILLRVSRWWK